MLLNIEVDSTDKLKAKDKKVLKEQFSEYLENVKNYLEKYKEFPQQKIALDFLKNINIDNKKHILNVSNPNEIIFKTSKGKIKLRTTLEKLKNSNEYIFDEINVNENKLSKEKKIYVVRKGNKIYSVFSGGIESTKRNFQPDIFYKRKSIDYSIYDGSPYFQKDEIMGKEFLLLLKYFLDKKKENPDEKIYLDLKDYAENYLEKYNKYTKYDDFLRSINDFVYINKNGFIFYKLKNNLNFHIINSYEISSTVANIKNKYDIYKIVGGEKYKELIFNDNYNSISC